MSGWYPGSLPTPTASPDDHRPDSDLSDEEGFHHDPERQRWFTTVILGASWIETSDSLLTSLIMQREREAILLWSLLILTSFIFALQDFLFLCHSGKLLDNTGRCQCKPPSCLLILDTSSLKYSPKHLLRARSQVSTHPPRTAWWVTAPGEESRQCAWRWGGVSAAGHQATIWASA